MPLVNLTPCEIDRDCVPGDRHIYVVDSGVIHRKFLFLLILHLLIRRTLGNIPVITLG